MRVGGIIFALFLVLPLSSLAAVPPVYTNENLFETTHDRPVSLFQDGAGGFYGYTETGKRFAQFPIENTYSIRLHKFSIDEAYFYMSDRGLIRAETDLAALSIYFARV